MSDGNKNTHAELNKNSDRNTSPLDVAIIGAGLAGLTCALQIRKACPDARIAVLERHAFPYPEAAHKVGESTVEVAAHYFTNVLGLHDHFRDDQLPKLGLRYFFQSGKSTDLNQRVELGSNTFFPRRTYQIDRGRFENFLAERCRANGVEILENAPVRDVTLSEGGAPHAVSYDLNGERMERAARWVVDASSRAALLKRKLDLGKEAEHKINAIWFRLNTKINIDDWYEDKEWTRENSGEKSRWFSTNHLMGVGYWVWVIPLSSGCTSVGIVADPRYHALAEMNTFPLALEWLEKNEPRCARAVRECDGELMDFLALKHFSRNARQVFSPDRWALTGDAGVFIDPLYSPGSDYIGFSNSFITELVSRDLAGKSFGELSNLYSQLLLTFSENTFRLYLDQYPLLGNAVVMPTKVVWDFAAYWSLYGFVFTHDKLCDLSLLAQTGRHLESLATMNREMQQFFREWNLIEHGEVPRCFIDVSKIPLLRELNARMVEEVRDEDFAGAVIENLRKVTLLGREIVDKVCMRHPDLKRPEFTNLAMQEKGEGFLGDFFPMVGLL